MTMNKKLQAFVNEAKATDSYWIENAKLDFALILEQQRRRAEVNYANLAKKIGASAAYISKVFRGDSNLTIESMVKLARATGGQLDIQIIDMQSIAAPRAAATATSPYGTGARQVTVLRQSVTQASEHAANHDRFYLIAA